MPGFAYYLPGVPPGASLSAFMPHAAKSAASSAVSYKGTVTGHPGTAAIPAPTRDTVTPGGAVGQFNMGTARSTDAPDTWYPAQYYERELKSGYPVTPVRIFSDNLMPVPAVDPRGRPARLARPIVQRGGAQLGQPPALPSWPPWGPGG